MGRIMFSSSVVIFAVFAAVQSTIPDYISVCPHDHKNLSGCIIESIEKLRPRLKVGIEELGIPSLEPLDLDPASIDSSGSDSRIATNLTNIRVWGSSDFKILKMAQKATKTGRSFHYEVIIPRLHLEGEYEIDSKLLFVNLQGKGPFNANVTDYHFECFMKGNKVEREGSNHLLFEKMQCNIDLKNATIFLDNLFNGNPVLGKATNDVLNDNWQLFFEEIKPSIQEALEQRFTDISNKITLAFKYEELFP